MSLALLFLYLMLNMFRMLIYRFSGASDLFVELFHGLYCSGSMCVGVSLWFAWVVWCGIRMQAEVVLQPAYGYLARTPVAAWSMAWVCGRSLTGVSGSNPA